MDKATEIKQKTPFPAAINHINSVRACESLIYVSIIAARHDLCMSKKRGSLPDRRLPSHNNSEEDILGILVTPPQCVFVTNVRLEGVEGNASFMEFVWMMDYDVGNSFCPHHLEVSHRYKVMWFLYGRNRGGSGNWPSPQIQHGPL